MKKLAAAIITAITLTAANAEKISDLASIVGIRDNALIGYGLVIGLNGSGDKSGSKFTAQSMANMLESMNVKLSPADIKSKNVAAVMVSATLPPFARQGDRLDIVVNSIGDAKSLEGGTLILTPLSAVDGSIYALAQGALSVGENPLSATLSAGGVVEKEVPFALGNDARATLSLKKSSLKNAIKIQQTINENFGGAVATAVDARTITLSRPDNLSMVEFLALVEEMSVDYAPEQKILIDQKNGTIIAGVGIRVSPVVVTHGGLTIKISDAASEEGAIDLGEGLSIDPAKNLLSTNGNPPTIAHVVKALQKLGASPKSVIAILGAMKKSGAISAEIEVM